MVVVVEPDVEARVVEEISKGVVVGAIVVGTPVEATVV